MNDYNNFNNNEILFSMNEMNTILENNNLTITNITKAYDNNNDTNNISLDSEKKEENSISKYDIENTNENLNKYEYKIILLGDVNVGKTAIFQRFLTDKFSNDYRCTINCE